MTRVIYSVPSTNHQRRNGLPKSLSRRSSGNVKPPIDPYANASPGSSDGEPDPRSTSSRRFSFHHNRTESAGSKPPSRPTSRLSRKRTSSTTSDKDREAAVEKPAPRRLSVAGWASSAVESVTNRGGKKNNKDKDNFATLDDEDEEGGTGRGSSTSLSLKKSTSTGSIGRKSPKKSGKDSYWTSPKVAQHVTKPGSPPEKKKLVRARFDYQAKSSNELTFRAGDEINVLNEVLDAWWMGELNGQCGLFPTTHIEIVSPSKVSAPLPMPQVEKQKQKSSFPPGLINNAGTQGDAQSFDDGYGTSELDEELDLGSRPLEHHSPFIEGLGDTDSITSRTTEDDSEHHATTRTPKQNNRDLDPMTPKSREKAMKMTSSSSESEEWPGLLFNAGTIGRNTSGQVPMAMTGTQTPTKKAPPPPPPRRAVSTVPAVAPPLPERKTNVSGGTGKAYAQYLGVASSTSSLASGSGSGSGGEGYDRSPFESSLDLSVGGPSDKANPFRAW